MRRLDEKKQNSLKYSIRSKLINISGQDLYQDEPEKINPRENQKSKISPSQLTQNINQVFRLYLNKAKSRLRYADNQQSSTGICQNAQKTSEKKLRNKINPYNSARFNRNTLIEQTNKSAYQIFSIPKIIQKLNKRQQDPQYHQRTHSSKKGLALKNDLSLNSQLQSRLKENIQPNKDIQIPRAVQLRQKTDVNNQSNGQNLLTEQQNKDRQCSETIQLYNHRSKTMQIQRIKDIQLNQANKKAQFTNKNRQMQQEKFQKSNLVYEQFQKYSRFLERSQKTCQKKIIQNKYKPGKQQGNTPFKSSFYLPEQQQPLIDPSEKSSDDKHMKIQHLANERSDIYRFNTNNRSQIQRFKTKSQKNDNYCSQHEKNHHLASIKQKKYQIMVKSNSNNKIFNRSTKKIVSSPKNIVPTPQNVLVSSRLQTNFKNTQQKCERQIIKFINLTSYTHGSKQKSQKKSLNFSWQGARIHQEGDKFFQMARKQSNKSTKRTKLSHERKPKISNNLNKVQIVITENNRSKINIFHNSVLLKQDPHKIDILTSLMREVSKKSDGLNSKIQIPRQLGINKFKIQQKSKLQNVNFKKIENLLIQNMELKIKQKRSSISKSKTQRTYDLKIEEVKPWEVHQAKEFQSNQQYFTHNQIDSKTDQVTF